MKKLFIFYNFIENQIHLKESNFFINNIFFEKPVIVDIELIKEKYLRYLIVFTENQKFTALNLIKNKINI